MRQPASTPDTPARPRRLICGLAVLLLALLAAGGAAEARQQETPSASDAAAPAIAGEAAEPAVIGTVIGEVQRLLADDAAQKGATEPELEALKTYYGLSDRSPLWIDGGAVSDQARALAAEIARAADYGLEADDFPLPDLDAGGSVERLARIELALARAVLKYARFAHGGRVEGRKLGQQLTDPLPLPDPQTVLGAMATSADPAAYLRSLHPTHPQFEALRKRLAELRGGGDEREHKALPEGPVLRLGLAHAHVALLRKRLGVEGDAPERFDAGVDKAVRAFQKANGLTADGIVGPGTRRALNGGQGGEREILKLLVNLERWRWLPRDLDAEAGIHVWANIPEYRVRIVREGKVAFNERVIVGKIDKKTPVFSDKMEWIEFHPTWYIPNSIKVESILPSFRRQTSRVMERYHLRLDCGRHGRDHKAIDWTAVDIRSCSISQPPGERSVLGDFKFKFPNRHAVYMHDTPKTGLFKRTTRTFSHGCVRIDNPRRMAEVLLAHDKAMSSERVGEILAGPKRLHKEELNRAVPVHITYFTTLVDEDGAFKSLPDIYGHDRRLANVLMGKGHLLPVPAIAKRRPRVSRPRASDDSNDWRRAILQN